MSVTAQALNARVDLAIERRLERVKAARERYRRNGRWASLYRRVERAMTAAADREEYEIVFRFRRLDLVLSGLTAQDLVEWLHETFSTVETGLWCGYEPEYDFHGFQVGVMGIRLCWRGQES